MEAQCSVRTFALLNVASKVVQEKKKIVQCSVPKEEAREGSGTTDP